MLFRRTFIKYTISFEHYFYLDERMNGKRTMKRQAQKMWKLFMRITFLCKRSSSFKSPNAWRLKRVYWTHASAQIEQWSVNWLNWSRPNMHINFILLTLNLARMIPMLMSVCCFQFSRIWMDDVSSLTLDSPRKARDRVADMSDVKW